MQMQRPYLILLLFFGLIHAASAQQLFSENRYPLVDFRPPLDITPPSLAGSFGELRPSHFHSGVDFRTNQRQGYPVYAIADGYISRIRIQNTGFGNALYINHPDGYTSVYGHLQRYNAKLSSIAKSYQYEKKSFEIDEVPPADQILVHKGDIIAYSGNTGSSGGPHLHFEIRDTKTEATINPQLFGIEVPDRISPAISALYVYKLNNQPFNEHTAKQRIPLVGGNGSYHINSTLNLSGEVGFGIIATDRHNGMSGLNGVYSITLEVDGSPVFTSSLERFKFENSKAINSHIDYPAYLDSKINIQKSFVDPGNPLGIYSNLVNRGRISFSDGKVHELKYIVTDVKGNTSTLPFRVQAGVFTTLNGLSTTVNSGLQPKGILFPYNKVNEFSTDSVKITLPVGTLYNDLDFQYKAGKETVAHGYSPVFQLQNRYTPLHTGFELSIKPTRELGSLANKAVIVNTNGVSQGGEYLDGYVKASPRSFGSYYIAVDTVPPVISPLNVSNGKNMHDASKMSFKIHDNLSGIKSFNGYIDGRWVLMEFDLKTATIWHSFDASTGAGKHKLELTVVDMKDNSRTLELTFYK
jgi:murein DD-endopeptidase MepM/ murein hydrolase activator NlpD